MSVDRLRYAAIGDRAVAHPIVKRVMEELYDNLGIDMTGLPRYGIHKVVSYAAQVGAAIADGLDPEVLRMSPAEATAAWTRILGAALDAGVPVTTVSVEGGD